MDPADRAGRRRAQATVARMKEAEEAAAGSCTPEEWEAARTVLRRYEGYLEQKLNGLWQTPEKNKVLVASWTTIL